MDKGEDGLPYQRREVLVGLVQAGQHLVAQRRGRIVEDRAHTVHGPVGKGGLGQVLQLRREREADPVHRLRADRARLRHGIGDAARHGPRQLAQELGGAGDLELRKDHRGHLGALRLDDGDELVGTGGLHQLPGVSALPHAGLLAQARGGLRVDPPVERRERPGKPPRKGQAQPLELLREFADHLGQRASVDIAHRAHLRGQPHLQLVGQIAERHIRALVHEKPHDDRRLLRAAQPRDRAARFRPVNPCRWCAHARCPVPMTMARSWLSSRQQILKGARFSSGRKYPGGVAAPRRRGQSPRDPHPSRSARYFSASSAAMHPIPALVTAWR